MRLIPLLGTLAMILPGAALVTTGAAAEGMEKKPGAAAETQVERTGPGQQASAPEDMGEEATDARQSVSEATDLVQQMRSDPQLQDLMTRAKGIFIVPDYGRGALLVGASGGDGLLVKKTNGEWSSPGFYDIGEISVGAQAGGSAGAIAMLLMSDQAVKGFEQNNSFSLNADAGLTIVDYSATATAGTRQGDIVLWSDTEGAFAGATVSVSNISWDEEENRAYYGKEVTPPDIITGRVDNPAARTLKTALPG